MTALFLTLPVFLLGGCQAEKQATGDGGQGRTDTGDDTGGGDSEESEFVLTSADLPSRIDVTLDGVALYTVTFTYDDARRLSAYSRKSAGDVIEEAVISYKSGTEASASCRRAGSEGTSSLSVRISSGRLVWSYPDINNGNRYSLLLDSGRRPSQYGYNVQYSGKKFTNLVAYGTVYGCSDGNLVSVENGAVSTSAGGVNTTCSAVPDFRDEISYMEKADRANLGSLVLAGEFLPWYMKGLPGNKRLVSRISHIAGGRTLDEYETVEYEDTDGRTSRMTVRQYSGSGLLHTKEYKISY